MHTNGAGSFAAALANAFIYADFVNSRLILSTWLPMLWAYAASADAAGYKMFSEE